MPMTRQDDDQFDQGKSAVEIELISHGGFRLSDTILRFAPQGKRKEEHRAARLLDKTLAVLCM